MNGTYALKSLPQATIPFFQKRRQLPDWVRAALIEAVPTIPDELRIETDIVDALQCVAEALQDICTPNLCEWLTADISAAAAWLGSIARAPNVRIRLEKLAYRACPKFHVDAVPMRLLCTYLGPGTEWTNANTAYSINFGEDADEELIHHVPPEAIVIYGGAKTAYGLTPLWHRSPDVASGHVRLLLCIDLIDAPTTAPDHG